MRTLLAALLVLGLLSVGAPASAEVPHVLVFSGTYGFRHSSITRGNQVLQELATSTGAFTVEVTENPLDLSAAKLAGVDVLLFNSVTGRVPLSAQQRSELTRYWGCGGGFVGVHAAADANYGWAEYAELVGAQFDSHPHGAGAGDVKLLVENATHPVNAAYASMTDWLHQDEYYRWMRDVRGTQDVTPLLSIDETTVAAGIQSGSTPYVHHQPVSWTKTFRGKGRVYYNNLGHNEATWDRAPFRTSLVDGIKWVSEVALNTACLTGSTPLPPSPSGPVPDPESPIEQCALAPGETRLTYAGVTASPAAPAAPVYFGKTQARYVVDLSGGLIHTADVAINLKWDVPTDDYDLAVTTPWGFGGSDALQPQSAPTESTTLRVPHCTPLLVSVFNHHGVTGRGLSLSLKVNAPPPDPAPPVTPGTAWVFLGPPSAAATGFVPPAGVITEGGMAYLENRDTTSHNMACKAFNPVTRRPLCESAYANPTTEPTLVPVTGVDKLPPGDWVLYCQLHPAMEATLTIVDTVAAKKAGLR